jgi:molybdopterin molybdotransferase
VCAFELRRKAEVFQPEGAGRIIGISWTDDLAELPDDAISVSSGTPFWFLPHCGFGL